MLYISYSASKCCNLVFASNIHIQNDGPYLHTAINVCEYYNLLLA